MTFTRCSAPPTGWTITPTSSAGCTTPNSARTGGTRACRTRPAPPEGRGQRPCVGVVMRLVVGQDGAQVCLAEDQGPVEELSAQGADEACAGRVHPRCPDLAAQDRGAGGLEDAIERGVEVSRAHCTWLIGPVLRKWLGAQRKFPNGQVRASRITWHMACARSPRLASTRQPSSSST